jgi:glycogen phosphorylase
MNGHRRIAYFSMEIALEEGMPTYSGGLGVLAGDTIRSAADLSIPMVAVTLLHRKGYFYQRLDPSGKQTEEPVEWVVGDYLEELPRKTYIIIEGRYVYLRAWKYEVTGCTGYKVPVYFLDTDLPENSDWDRTLTHFLYGGDQRYRLCQEVILGIGGVRMLRALGYKELDRFHMNEGHPSLLTLRLMREEAIKAGRKSICRDDIEAVRNKCIFTTHTPVPAGHDQFPLDLARKILAPRDDFFDLKDEFCVDLMRRVFGKTQGFDNIEDLFRGEGTLNLTYLALNLSHYINGVAKKHGEVSRLMFAGYTVSAITNGVHAATWASPPFQQLYNHYIPGWKEDNFSLRSALNIPKTEVWEAHSHAKRNLIRYVNREANVGMDKDYFTLGFARRATTYKRPDLLFTDLARLKAIAENIGPIQVIYGGKAHPKDSGGKELIQQIFKYKEQLKDEIKIVYLEDYDIELGKLITSGVDVWLNTPLPPNEASGTSGMKAALNGIPSLSILDGWWIEGHIEGVTGWSIGNNGRGMSENSHNREEDAVSLYEKLEGEVMPLFYNNQDRFIDVMRHTIALNGSFFNTHRMVQQYVLNAYFR